MSLLWCPLLTPPFPLPRPQHFSVCGRLHSAVVSRKKDPRRPDSWLSQGYGFVSYVRRKHAKKALKELQQAALDGHALELKVSNRTTASVERVTGWPDGWLIGQTGKWRSWISTTDSWTRS